MVHLMYIAPIMTHSAKHTYANKSFVYRTLQVVNITSNVHY